MTMLVQRSGCSSGIAGSGRSTGERLWARPLASACMTISSELVVDEGRNSLGSHRIDDEDGQSGGEADRRRRQRAEAHRDALEREARREMQAHAEQDQSEQRRRQLIRAAAGEKAAEEGERVAEARRAKEDPAQADDVEGEQDAQAVG